MASRIYPSVRPENGDIRLQANASSAEIRNKLRPYTKGLNPWDTQGGSLRGIPDPLRIQLLKGV